uniref:thioesterase II family protein n=1 Tax=Stappia sp. TaxID=1870903 RepID=UPI003BA84B09
MMNAPHRIAPAWFPFGLPDGRGRAVLFAFHHAGGAASFFHGWRDHPLLADVDVCPVELPGRGRRFAEVATTGVDGLLAGLVPALCSAVPAGRPVILFGHSLGSLIAFEAGLALQARGLPPSALIASARRAPQLPTPRPWRHSMSDMMLVGELHRLGGTSDEVLESEELLELFLPAIRADFALTETYALRAGSRIGCPVLALRGEGDPEVSAADVDAWEEVCGSRFARADLPGDHFYLSQPSVLADVLARLRRHAGLA